MDVHQYGSSALVRPMESFSALLDSFYNERALADRLRQRANDLLKLLANTQERIARKLDVQRQELVQSEGRETLKMYGDLLSANLYQIQKGSTAVTLPNFYSEQGEEVNILLDPLLTPAQNAQKYYTEYKKAATAERKLLGLIAQGEEELQYLDSVFDELTRASGEQELLQIRQELASSGYLRHYKGQKGRGEHKLAPDAVLLRTMGLPYWLAATTCRTTSLPCAKAATATSGFTPKKYPAAIRLSSPRAKRYPTARWSRRPLLRLTTARRATRLWCRWITPLSSM